MIKPHSRVDFPKTLCAKHDLSAIAHLSPDHLVIAGDEGHAVEVLKRSHDGSYTLAQSLMVVSDLNQNEADIEDICCLGPVCYVIGSHSRRRKKIQADRSYAANRRRLLKAPKSEPTRAVLFQLEFDSQTAQLSLKKTRSLKKIIRNDPLLQQFVKIPSKENGIDIEGLAIKDQSLYVGFRSPVLRDNYVPVLVLDTQKIKHYELRFVQMGGRGVRAMAETQDGILILAGPPSDGEGTYDVYLWDGKDMIPGNDVSSNHHLSHLGTLDAPDAAKAEGLALLSEQGDRFEIVVIYDGIEGGYPSLFYIPKPPAPLGQ